MGDSNLVSKITPKKIKKKCWFCGDYKEDTRLCEIIVYNDYSATKEENKYRTMTYRACKECADKVEKIVEARTEQLMVEIYDMEKYKGDIEKLMQR